MYHRVPVPHTGHHNFGGKFLSTLSAKFALKLECSEMHCKCFISWLCSLKFYNYGHATHGSSTLRVANPRFQPSTSIIKFICSTHFEKNIATYQIRYYMILLIGIKVYAFLIIYNTRNPASRASKRARLVAMYIEWPWRSLYLSYLRS